MGVLVVVPCGRKKAWAQDPSLGPQPAQEAYTGTPFKLNRAYAERFGDRWVVLSAKHGIVLSDSLIPGDYDVSFTDRRSRPIGIDRIRGQVTALELDRADLVVGLGGVAYRTVIERAFAGTGVAVVFPFAGLPIGRLLQATRRAVEAGDPGFELEDDGYARR